MKKVLMLATTAAMIEQFNKNNILILEEMGYEVHVAGNWLEGNPISDEKLEIFKGWITEHGGKYFHIPAVRRPSAMKANVAAYRKVVELIKEYDYEFIHCHTPIGSVIGRIAAHTMHTKIIYTAHGFHFFKGAPLINWLLYYPVERFFSRWTDILITINQEDYNRAKKSFHAKKTEYIPGVGVDTKKFACCQVNKSEKCNEIGIPDNKFVLLSVGELQSRKNQKLVIEALYRLRNPDIYYLIVGKCELFSVYEELIHKYDLENNVKLLGFRTDIDELCEIADCFVHPSIREGLGIAPLEAMASGLPLISADINGMKDYTKDGVTGCCINPKSVESMCEAIRRMHNDKTFREKCGQNNLEIVKNYTFENSNEVMKKLYDKSSFFGGSKHLTRVLNTEMLREKLKFKSADFIIVSVGELNKNKNHEIVMRAIARIGNQKMKYIICGQGVLRDYLRVLSEELKISDQVRILGYKENVADYLYMADVFAFPSKREGLGLAAVEAMAAGLPLIGSDIHGIKDYLVDGVTGYSFKPESIEDVCSAVKRIYENIEFRKKCGEINRKTAKKFDLENCRKAMTKLYEW